MAQEADLPNARERAAALVERGLDFLQTQQQPDGTWQSEPHVPPAYTALALRAFVNSEKHGPDAPLVRRGFDALLGQQVEDGGIYDNLLANYNTAIAISALAAAQKEAGDERYRAELHRAVTYLRRLQWTPETDPDSPEDKPGEEQRVSGEEDPFFGGWGYGGRSRGPGRPDLSNAQIALDALHDAGVPASDPAFQRAVTFVGRLQNYETNSAEWAGTDGGFIYSPGGDRNFESFAGEYVTSSGQRRLRSYGSMTYAGFKSMVYAGLGKDDPRVQAAFNWITSNWTLDENPGISESNPENADYGLYYYYLTLGRALNAFDQPILETAGGAVDWRLQFIEKMAELQKPDGSWSGNPRWQEDDPTLVTSYVVLALQEVMEDLEEHPAK